MINSSKWLFLLLLVDLNVFVHSNADKSHTLLNDWQSYLQNHSKEPKQNAMQILARVNCYLQQNAQDQNIRHLQCKIFHYLGKSDSLLVYGKRFLDHWPHSECSEEIRYDLFDLFCKRNQHDLAQAMMTKLRMRRWRYSALMTLERAAKGASQDSITGVPGISGTYWAAVHRIQNGSEYNFNSNHSLSLSTSGTDAIGSWGGALTIQWIHNRSNWKNINVSAGASLNDSIQLNGDSQRSELPCSARTWVEVYNDDDDCYDDCIDAVLN
jgi:hypothetical protein